MVVRTVNKLKTRIENEEKSAAAAEPAPTPPELVLLAEIRDLLKKRD